MTVEIWKPIKNFENEYELIFINDGSRDKCGDIVREYIETKNPHVRLVDYETNMGKGYAVRQGVLASEGDIVMFTDCDLAYGTDVIKRFYDEMIKSGADIAVGSRNLDKSGYEGYTFTRKLASKLYIKVLCIIGGLRLSDSQCGCKAFDGKMGKSIFSLCEVNRFAFDFEAILIGTHKKAKIIEIPVKIINHSESSMHIVSDSIKMVRDIMKMKKRIRKMEK